MMTEKIKVTISGVQCDSACIALPGYPSESKSGFVSKTICLDDLIDGLQGPRINLDFNYEGLLIGIEVIA